MSRFQRTLAMASGIPGKKQANYYLTEKKADLDDTTQKNDDKTFHRPLT